MPLCMTLYLFDRNVPLQHNGSCHMSCEQLHAKHLRRGRGEMHLGQWCMELLQAGFYFIFKILSRYYCYPSILILPLCMNDHIVFYFEDFMGFLFLFLSYPSILIMNDQIVFRVVSLMLSIIIEWFNYKKFVLIYERVLYR